MTVQKLTLKQEQLLSNILRGNKDLMIFSSFFSVISIKFRQKYQDSKLESTNNILRTGYDLDEIHFRF